jgi:hypothetical protein
MPAFIFLTSCKKDEVLTPTDLTEKYPMTAGTNAADLFRFNFFNKYQTKILFDFDKKDYWYAMSSSASSSDSIDVFRFVTDTAKQRRAVEFLNAQWLLFYPASLKQTYLPQYIFAVDRLLDYNSTGTTVDSTKYYKTNSFNNMTIAGLGNRFDTMSATTKARLRNELNFNFLYSHIYLKNKNFFPQEFYDVSALKYGVLTRDSVSTVYNDYLNLGLLPPDGLVYPGVTYPGSATSFNKTLYQSQDNDVAQYIRMITLQNDAFINNIINNTYAAKVKQKYLLLVNFFTSIGINIRSINNYNITAMGPLDTY